METREVLKISAVLKFYLGPKRRARICPKLEKDEQMANPYVSCGIPIDL